jgi:hypothetical protein
MIEASGVFLIGLTTACIMALATVAQTWITGRQATSRQTADWARQDEVADRAAKAAQDLVESNRRIAAEARTASNSIIASNEKIKSDIAEVRDLGEKTHGLVNSAMTAVKQAELDGLVRELGLMKRIPSVSPEEISEIEVKIIEKQTEIGDRARAASLVNNKGG